MSNRLFQGVIHQMKDAIDRTIGVIDENYTVIACNDLGKIGRFAAGRQQTDRLGVVNLQATRHRARGVV